VIDKELKELWEEERKLVLERVLLTLGISGSHGIVGLNHGVCSTLAKERMHSPDVLLKLSKSLRGNKNKLGKKHSPVSKENMREGMLRKWQNPEYSKMIWDAMNVSPNKSELKLQSILQELSLPYRFVGDGQVIINGKCPDFINTNGQKKLIELFGDYWHDIEIVGHPIEKEIEERTTFFSQLGFKTLIILDSELTNIESVKIKILEFHNGRTQ
jgi:hypothetical protein